MSTENKEATMFTKLLARFKAFSASISADMAETFEEEMRGRQDRQLTAHYQHLCAEVDVAETLWKHGLSEKERPEYLARREHAILELRYFLGRLTEEQAKVIATVMANDCVCGDVELLSERIYAFLRQEGSAADDASEREICTHLDRCHKAAFD
jgi:hypothetical protein